MYRKVISLALFGEKTRYGVYAGAVVRAYLTLFPEFEVWVHHDAYLETTAGGRFLRRAAEGGLVTLVPMGEAPLTAAMLWRIAPVWNEGVEYVFARDIDSLPTPRERACVDSFMISGLTLHTIHDSASHDGIMGGLSGFHAVDFIARTGFKSLAELRGAAQFSRERWATHGTDQDVLNSHVSPKLAGHIFEHMYAGWSGGRPGVSPYVPRQPKYLGIAEYVPDVVEIPGRTAEWVRRADALIAHMGGAGFDYETAARFYDEEAPSQTMRAIADAEKEP